MHLLASEGFVRDPILPEDCMSLPPEVGLEDLPVFTTVVEPLGESVASRTLHLSTQQFAGDESLPNPVPEPTEPAETPRRQREQQWPQRRVA